MGALKHPDIHFGCVSYLRRARSASRWMCAVREAYATKFVAQHSHGIGDNTMRRLGSRHPLYCTLRAEGCRSVMRHKHQHRRGKYDVRLLRTGKGLGDLVREDADIQIPLRELNV